MHRRNFWLCIISLLYFSKEIYCDECPDDTDFMCRSDESCIASKKVCDGKRDCEDGSDEIDCECQPPDWYLCEDNKTCISHSQVCDGSNDCPTHDDEDVKKCVDHYVPHHLSVECGKNEFTCISDGTCVPLELACDGTKQCMDGSDETIGCQNMKNLCKGFLCKNGHCLTDVDWVCDGIDDCGDNSDEEQKCTYNCTLSSGNYLCKDNETCIPLNRTCDGHNDCPGGDDESNACKSKDECSKFECPTESKCQHLPNGPTCICPKGFRFNATVKKCDDINECLKYDICSQGCFNTVGGYQCQCAPKFKLNDDNRTCTPISQTEPLLVYAASSSVNTMTLRSNHMQRIADNLNQVIGICYYDGYVYWTDISVQVESVMRSRLTGSPEVLFTSGLGKPEDIAIDHITGNIYISDYDHQHIAVCSNDARYCRDLIHENVHRPRGIALYSQKGRIYWTDWGIMPMIGVASMDGKSAKPFISNNIHWPNGLALDWPNNRLYWVDAKLKTIESCKLDGSDRRSVIEHASRHPYGIAVFEDKLYWSDWDSKSIQSSDKFTGKHRKTVIQDKIIYDLHIYHPAMLGFRKNPCKDTHCAQLCLLNDIDSYTCACSKNWDLSSNNHSCTPSEKRHMLLLGVGNRFILMEHQAFGRHNDADGKTVYINIHKMAYNSLKGNVLVADNNDKIIYEVEIKNKNFQKKKLLTDNIGNITAMAFDDYANNLYWADAERSTIEVYSFITQHRAVVHHFMGDETPIGLIVLPENGKLYVALRSKSHTHLDMMSSNGRGQHYHLLEDEIGSGPVNLLVDHELKEIFWTDYEHARISYTTYKGDTFYTFVSDVTNPVSITVIGDDLFWTTKSSTILNWTPKHVTGGTKSMIISHPITTTIPEAMVLLTITPIKTSKHPCILNNNNGCSHICVALGEEVASCLCPNGMVFSDSSNTTCIKSYDCYFRCGSGECITESKLCNFQKDCADHSDEQNCKTKNKTISCSLDEFACADHMKCIPRKLRCDKQNDCDDKSDERDCENFKKDSECHDKSQFMCNDGICIDQMRLCDGYTDCSEGEDEVRDQCDSHGTCGPNEFRCDSGQCIAANWVCDDALDCTDGSDEKKCHSECGSDFRRCNHGSCVHKELWCDGNNDCGDFSDETNCTLTTDLEISCGDSTKFQCKSNRTICLNASQRCNGKAECPNGEDEVNCGDCQGQFECSVDECIPMQWRCDNHKDCKNGKDEMNCDMNSTTINDRKSIIRPCKDDEYKCHNDQCIDWARVCDNKEDCSDGSDESHSCVNACQDSPCEHKCHRTPHGAVCSCHEGYELNADKKTCKDIDECKNGDIPCAHLCHNTQGSYRCSCFPDYSLQRDEKSCKSNIGEKKFIIYSAFDAIYRSRSNLKKIFTANNSKILGMDYNLAKELLYFTVEDRNILYEMNWNTSRINYVENLGNPTHIACDWITNNVYVIDHLTAIKVCHMEGSYCITLIEFLDGEHIKSLTVDPLHRYLFYAVLKKFEFTTPETTIYRHNLDGSNKKMISKNSFFVSAITTDLNTERLYYTGLDTMDVWSVKYDGTDKRQIFARNEYIKKPIQINLFESRAYILNSGSKMVAICAIYGEKNCQAFNLNVDQPENFLVVQQSRQKSIENACEKKQCQTICTPTDDGAKCVCHLGQSIAEGQSCNHVGSAYNYPHFYKHSDYIETESMSAVKMVFGTILVIFSLICLVMGGFFLIKRYRERTDSNISIHFANNRTGFDAARVKMEKLNEISINPRMCYDSSLLDETTESNDLSAIYQYPTTSDDTKKLLP